MKLAQIEVYRAEAAWDAVKNEGAYYASHYYNSFFVAGMQTTAWEIWEQLGRALDVIVMLAGQGTNMVGM